MLDLLEVIRKSQDRLSRCESVVAEILLTDPEVAMNGSLVDLAERCGVSQPTVIRFCRSIGCSGFRDFKLALVQSMARKRTFLNADVTREDSIQVLVQKVVDANAGAVMSVPEKLDESVLNDAIAVLGKARQIIFFGMGGSGVVAQDARHKFLRFDTPCEVYTDPIMLRMAVAGRGENNVIVLISTTGRTSDVVETAEIAAISGYHVVSITEPDTPLSRVANTVIHMQPMEDTNVLIPMATRLMQLTVVDVLTTGVALFRGGHP